MWLSKIYEPLLPKCNANCGPFFRGERVVTAGAAEGTEGHSEQRRERRADVKAKGARADHGGSRGGGEEAVGGARGNGGAGGGRAGAPTPTGGVVRVRDLREERPDQERHRESQESSSRDAPLRPPGAGGSDATSLSLSVRVSQMSGKTCDEPMCDNQMCKGRWASSPPALASALSSLTHAAPRPPAARRMLFKKRTRKVQMHLAR